MEQTTKRSSWFGSVESKEKAIKVIGHVSKVFIILGLIQIFGGFAFANFSFESKIAMGVSGIIYIGLGYLLGKFKKIAIAIILLLLSLAGVILALMNLFGVFGTVQNKGLPIIGIALAIASIQAIKATKKYEEK